MTAHLEVSIGDRIEQTLNELFRFECRQKQRLLCYYNGEVCQIQDTFLSKDVKPGDRFVLFASKTIYPNGLLEWRRAEGNIASACMSLAKEEGLSFYARADVKIFGILFHREVSNKAFTLKVKWWLSDDLKG